MKEKANNYLIDKWKDLPPFRTSCRFTSHIHWSWPYATSCRMLDLSFTIRASYPAMGDTPLEEKSQNILPQNSSLLLLKAKWSL